MRKATGSHCTYSIPGKTATFVPEFAVEDLPSAELQPGSCVCSEGPALGQNTLMMMMMMMMIENCIHIHSLFKQCSRVNYQHTIKSEVTWKWVMYVARIQMMSPVALHKSRRFTVFILLPTLSFISGCSHLLPVNLSG